MSASKPTAEPSVSQRLATTPKVGQVERATTLDEATRALDFSQPLPSDDARWVDLSGARGDHARRMLARKLQRKTPESFGHLAFVSHRGAGKSTELLRLREDLGTAFSQLYFVANVEMDAQRIDREDLMLVLAQGVEAFMRREGLPLDTELLAGIAKWFSEVTNVASWLEKANVEVEAKAQVGTEVPFFVKLFAGFKSLVRVESETRSQIKSTLRQYPGTLLRLVNQLLDNANTRLGQAGRGELLVLIDNLDRYHPDVMDDLLVKGGDTLRRLRCNLVVTPPIGLQYQPQTARLDQYFDVEVLHAPRLRRKDQPFTAFDGPGRDLLNEVLSKRIDLQKLLPEDEARNRLIAATGGAIRELLRLAREASLLPEAGPITLRDVETVVQKARATLRDLINVNGWHEPLVDVLSSKQLTSHEACLDLLHHRLVLKYNGENWYDVHPLIAEIPEIQELVSKRKAAGEGGSPDEGPGGP